jgi:hypothetical protein
MPLLPLSSNVFEETFTVSSNNVDEARPQSADRPNVRRYPILMIVSDPGFKIPSGQDVAPAQWGEGEMVESYSALYTSKLWIEFPTA